MRKISYLLFIFLLASLAQAAPAEQSNPTIASFTTPAKVVDRTALANRTARIPVAWTTANRPNTANLVFEQVLPDGKVVNVELPRDNPWVASAGDGTAAPYPPGGNASTILLRVRLVDLIKATTLDQREITLPIGDGPAITPVIREFISRVNIIGRAALTSRAARIPVTWAVDNRPDNSNLVFEQVLPDGKVVNVELPRSNPWVASAGVGVAAPVAPAANVNTIKLQVRLINLQTQAELTKRDLTITISEDMPTGYTIDSFTSSVASVSRATLTNRTARVPVSWSVSNRPSNSNLVFEQVLDSGSVVNVELPRSNPWVASAGNGVAAPVIPGNSNSVKLQVRLIDLTTQAELAKRDLTLAITDANAPARILSFTTSAAAVDLASLASRSARVPVAWAVENRPDNSNLVFEQVLDNGNVINVELPRSNPWVASVGSGVAAPVGPVNPATTSILLRVRLVNLTNNATLDTKEITLPITGGSGGTFFREVPVAECYGSTHYYPVDRGLVVGGRARITNQVGAEGLGMVDTPNPNVNRQQVGILPAGTTISIVEGPYCYRALYTSNWGQLLWRMWKVKPDNSTTAGWVSEFSFYAQVFTFLVDPISGSQPGGPQIVSFTATPSEVPINGTVTLAWNVTGATEVVLSRVTGGTSTPLDTGPTPLSLVGAINYTLPSGVTGNVDIKLSAYKPGQTTLEQTVRVKVTCPYTNALAATCPESQQTVNAAYQSFEHGHMIWRGDTKEIFVLYSDGAWAKYTDTWAEGETFDVGQTPPNGLLQPEHGFGKVWATQPGVRDKLGWATAAESSYSARWELHPTWNNAGEKSSITYFTLPDGRTTALENPWRMW